jgi:pyrroline-5-carboxylate reductase
MLNGARIAFVGVGVMGEAIISGVLADGPVAPSSVVASHPRPQRLEELRNRFQVQTNSDNRQAVASADVVVLCVKPQVLPRVLAELREAVHPRAFVLSIVAGARIGTIAANIAHSAVVRCMPNTPGQIREGVSVWTATTEVSPPQRQQAQAILRALGRDLFVENEAFLDMATAVSGTGPAYVFLLMEALIDAAVHLGFSRADARQLVQATIRGAAIFAERSGLHPAELRNMVTSPGGTSAAALYQLEKGGFRTVISKAVWAAYQRSIALGQLARPSFDPDANGEGVGNEVVSGQVSPDASKTAK